MVNSVLLKVGLLDENLSWGVKYCLCCVKANILDCFDYPLLDLVAELLEVDVILLLCVNLTVYVDCLIGDHTCKLDVETILTDSK